MSGIYQPILVVLSIAIAMLASFVALELVTRVTATRGRIRMEQALRETEERFRMMIDSLADGIVLQLADFSISTCNASAERITGLTAEQMLARAPRPEGWLAIREDGSRRNSMNEIQAACAALEQEIAHLQQALATFVEAA